MGFTSAATAQDPSIEVANRAVARACQDLAGRTIDASRISRFVVLERDARLPDNPDLPAPQLAERERDRALLLLAVTSYLQEQLAVPNSHLAEALAVSPAPPPPRDPTDRLDWLFAGSGGYTLTCAAADPKRPPAYATIARVVVRGSVDELDAVGDDRLTAGAAKLAWDRLRTTNLKGDTTRTTTVTLEAAIALAIGNVDGYGMMYADYSLSRVRKRRSPEEIPDDDSQDDDIDALEIGLLGTIRPAPWLRTTGRIGVTIDSVTDSRYLHGGLTLVPITGGLPNLGFCNLNSFRLFGLGIEGKCTLAAEADVRYVLQNGNAEFDESDTLLALGGVVGAEFRRALDLSGNPQDGLVASVTYRYLPLVEGDGPDIDRLDASVGYRWWAGDLGFELGLTYADGTERKSLANENRVGVTFGVIY